MNKERVFLPHTCRRLAYCCLLKSLSAAYLRQTSLLLPLEESFCRRSAADCFCRLLVCGKSAAKILSAAYSLPQTFSLRQVCGRSAAGLRQTFHFPMGKYILYEKLKWKIWKYIRNER